MRLQQLPFLFLFSIAFAARIVRAEDETFSWTWCELVPFLPACKDDAPPCDDRFLRRKRRSESSEGFSWTWCELFGFICDRDEDNGDDGCKPR